MAKSEKPYSVGRIVMYATHDKASNNGADVAPAMIVRTWEDTSYQNDEVNLKVLSDGPDNHWVTSVPYSGTKEPGTWHWPEIKPEPPVKAE